MILPNRNIFYGWFVVFGSAFVVFGISGAQFSFGVFLKPMTDDFGWSRATLSLAFGVTFMISGLLRPVAGYLADRYSAKWAALTGVLVMGIMLLLLPQVSNLLHLYIVFAVMSIGITLGTGPILTKIVSQWFATRRGVTLGLVGGAGSFGAMILVPASTAFLILFEWEQAYRFLGLLLLVLVFPIGAYFIKDRPQDIGLRPYGDSSDPTSDAFYAPNGEHPTIELRDATFREALRSPLFQRLTFGYFV